MRRFFYGYRIVAASVAIQVAGGGALATYGVFFAHLQAEFDWSRAAISGAYSMCILLMGAFAILCGRLTDRIGPRIVMTISGIALGGGYLLMSGLGSIWHLYLVFGLLVGAGMSTQDVVTLSTVARWFEARRGMMTGIIKVGTGAGQLLMPSVAAALIVAYSWRGAYVVIGAVVLLTLLLGSQFLRRDPRQLGLQPLGRPTTGEMTSGSADVEKGLTFGEGVRTRQFWLVCMAEFSIVFCLMTSLVHLAPHAQDMGISPTRAGALISVIGGASIVARLAVGSGSDIVGCRKAFTLCFAMLFLGLIWLQFASAMWMLVLYAVADGIARGGNFVVMSPLMAELFGTRAHGALFGLATFIGTIGGALGPLLAGQLFDLTSSYATTFTTLAVLVGIGLGATLLLRPLVAAER